MILTYSIFIHNVIKVYFDDTLNWDMLQKSYFFLHGYYSMTITENWCPFSFDRHIHSCVKSNVYQCVTKEVNAS